MEFEFGFPGKVVRTKKDKPGVVGDMMVLGISESSGFLAVGWIMGLLVAPVVVGSKGTTQPRAAHECRFAVAPLYTPVWRDGSGNTETERAILASTPL